MVKVQFLQFAISLVQIMTAAGQCTSFYECTTIGEPSCAEVIPLSHHTGVINRVQCARACASNVSCEVMRFCEDDTVCDLYEACPGCPSAVNVSRTCANNEAPITARIIKRGASGPASAATTATAASTATTSAATSATTSAATTTTEATTTAATVSTTTTAASSPPTPTTTTLPTTTTSTTATTTTSTPTTTTTTPTTTTQPTTTTSTTATTTITTTPTTTTTPTAAAATTQDYSMLSCGSWIQFQASCYYFYTGAGQVDTLIAARQWCGYESASVAVPNTFDENEFIKSQFAGQNYWIDIEQVAANDWRFPDGTTPSYNGWVSGLTFDLAMPCAYYASTSNMKWRPRECSNQPSPRPYLLCEKPAV